MLDLDEIQLEQNGHDSDLEEAEQNLEDEAEKMLKSWNRDELLKEVDGEKERILNDNKFIEYYDGNTDFEELIPKMTKLHGGRVFVEVLESKPEGKEIRPFNTILFDRVGYLEFHETPFESSTYDGKPSMLNLAEGPVIPGMLEALLSLHEGERANVLIHPALAYGKYGCPPLIPGDASLFYNIKIHKVWEESDLSEILEYERSYRVIVPIEEKLAFINQHKDLANKYWNDDRPRDAIIRYKVAIKCLEEAPEDLVGKSPELRKLRSTLYQNMAISFNKLEMYKSATKAARKALLSDPNNVKAHYHLVKARIALSDYTGALRYIEKAKAIAPNNSSLDHLRLQLDSQFRNEKKERDEIMRKMSRACLSSDV